MITLPDMPKARTVVSAVLRRDVAMVAIKPIAPGDLFAAGVYVDHGHQLVAACFADKALVAFAGAALSLIPADAAQDALRQTTIDDDILENFAEVLNICSRLIKMPADARLTLSQRGFSAANWPLGALDIVTTSKRRVDFEVAIDRYGTGRLVVALKG